MDGLFSGAMLVLGSVTNLQNFVRKSSEAMTDPTSFGWLRPDFLAPSNSW